METFDINKHSSTRVRVRGIDATGKIVYEHIGKNTFTYSASDIILNGVLGSGPCLITRLYGHFINGTASNGLLPNTNSGLITTVRSNFLDTTTVSGTGGFWLNKLSAPVQSPSTSNYIGNSATIYFRISSTLPSSQVTGPTFSSSSYVTALGLAVPFDPNDPTQDRIYSALNYTAFPTASAFQIPNGGQIAVDYSFTFTS